jgi:hypothetical protein
MQTTFNMNIPLKTNKKIKNTGKKPIQTQPPSRAE